MAIQKKHSAFRDFNSNSGVFPKQS